MKHKKSKIRNKKIDRYSISARLSEIAWDSAHPRECLEQLYNVTVDLADCEMAWYRDRVWQYRLGSRIVRILAVSLLAVGALLPILNTALASMGQDTEWIKAYIVGQLGYAALVLAGLLFLVDQIFLLNSGWTRFLSTELTLYTHLLQTRFLWLSLQAEWGSAQPQDTQVREALNKLMARMMEVTEIVRAETNTWSTELQSGLDALRSRIDAAKSGAEARVKEIEEGMASVRDPGDGTIEVKVNGPSLGNEDIAVIVCGKTLSKAKTAKVNPPGNILFTGLEEGKYIVNLVINSASDRKISKVVPLGKGADAVASFDFPSQEIEPTQGT